MHARAATYALWCNRGSGGCARGSCASSHRVVCRVGWSVGWGGPSSGRRWPSVLWRGDLHAPGQGTDGFACSRAGDCTLWCLQDSGSHAVARAKAGHGEVRRPLTQSLAPVPTPEAIPWFDGLPCRGSRRRPAAGFRRVVTADRASPGTTPRVSCREFPRRQVPWRLLRRRRFGAQVPTQAARGPRSTQLGDQVAVLLDGWGFGRDIGCPSTTEAWRRWELTGGLLNGPSSWRNDDGCRRWSAGPGWKTPGVGMCGGQISTGLICCTFALPCACLP